MLDNLRDQASSSPLFQPEEPPEIVPDKPKPSKSNRRAGRALGLTPFQLFFLTLMLFLMVLFMGAAFLLLTGKIVPPFLNIS